MRQTEEAMTTETSQRFSELEKHCSALESRLSHAFSCLTISLDRHKGLAEFAQNSQSDEESDWMQSAMDKMTDIESAIAEVVGESLELVAKECAMHVTIDDQQVEQLNKCSEYESGQAAEKAQREFQKLSTIAELPELGHDTSGMKTVVPQPPPRMAKSYPMATLSASPAPLQRS